MSVYAELGQVLEQGRFWGHFYLGNLDHWDWFWDPGKLAKVGFEELTDCVVFWGC